MRCSNSEKPLSNRHIMSSRAERGTWAGGANSARRPSPGSSLTLGMTCGRFSLPIGVLRPGAKWAAVFLLATTSLVPPPPYPELAKAEAYAREVMSKFTPARLEQALFEDPIQ